MREIVGYPMYTLFEDGKVFSNFSKKFLSPVLDTTGYYIYTLCNEYGKRNKSVHRLLAVHFLDNPDNKPHVNHLDGVKTNNSLENLEWATVKENSMHAVSLGLTRERTISQSFPVTAKEVLTGEVRDFCSIMEASRVLSVPQPNITKVLKGQRKSAGGYTWKHL